jgi:MarR family transcriptional regulator for hemolysin
MPSRKSSDRASFGSLLSRAARQWRRAADLRLQPFDLTEATWLPLVHIARAPEPPRQKDLAASMSLDGSSVVRLLDNLEAAGLIQRKEGENDRRAKIILLTARGRAIAQRVETVARRIRGDALTGLSDKDIETTVRVLKHVCRVLDATAEAAT